MSNTVPWGQNTHDSQQGGGPVTFFDPSKFQKTQEFPGLTGNQQGNNEHSPNQQSSKQNTDQGGHSTAQTASANAWNSWSWGDASNPYLKQQQSRENTAEYNGLDYNYQNQWNGQQWNQEQPQQQQSDQIQYYWDQNTQQWQPNYYDPSQQGVDQSQYNYSQYWNSAVGQSNSTETQNYQMTNTTDDLSTGQNNTDGTIQNEGFAQQEHVRQIDHSSVSDTNQPDTDHHANENSQQDNEYLNESNSSYGQNQVDYLNQLGDDGLDQSEGSIGSFYVNDYVGEGETSDSHFTAEPLNAQELTSLEKQGSQPFDVKGIANSQNTTESGDTVEGSAHIPSQTVDTEPGGVPNEVVLESHSVPFNDHMSQTHVNQEYTAKSEQSNQYISADGEQGHPEQVAKESDKEEEMSQPAKSETHSEDGWELVHPHGLGPPSHSHSRNQSMDNNVQFFISSGNSSLRVSPSGSSKSKDEVESIPGQIERHVDDVKNDSENLKDKIEKTVLFDKSHVASGDSNELHGSVPPPQKTAPLSGPPPSSSLGPPPVGGTTGVNPFRKSPLVLNVATTKTDNPSPITHDFLLSSTRLDTTKTNFENSPVSLNQSISPIPPNLESQGIDNTVNDSPDIQELTKPGCNPDTPLSSQRKGINVPQSPIMPRKESPFQPPVPVPRNHPDSRSKPVKASHNIPGVSANVSQNPSIHDKKISEYEKDKAGRRTPDWDNSQREKNRGRTTPDLDGSVEKLTESRSGRRTPDWDTNRKNYDRRTGRRTPDWDKEKTRDRNRGRRTPDWDSRQNSDRHGRRTPDWDSQRTSERNQGRRTPDWDSRQSSSRYGRKTPEWDQSDDNPYRSYDRSDDRRDLDEDRLSGKPPVGSFGAINKGQPRSLARQSAFREMVKNRSKNNISPATSLLDFEPPAMSNILLVPAASNNKTVKKQTEQSKDTLEEELSDLKPVASLISSISEKINTVDSVSKIKDQTKSKSTEKTEKLKPDNSREPNVRTGYEKNSDKSSRETLRPNRSYDKGLNDSRNASREKLRSYGSRDSLESELRDDSRERHRRGNSRDRDRVDPYDRYYRDRDRDRERPPSRNTEDYRRNGYRDREYGRYDRPRSRHDENRPPSRQGDMDRSRSRADYDRDYYRQRAYDYDDYYRHTGQYYDRNYYDYYYYSQGYYDDMGYYHDPNATRYAYDQYQRRQKAGTPGSLSDAGDESKNVDKKKSDDSESKQKRFEYPPDLHQYSSYYDDPYGYYGDYNGQRWDPLVQAWVQQNAVEQEPRRATPEKFPIPHMKACFGPDGQLVKILPNRPTDGQPATIEIHEVEAMLGENVESEELREFPGPLIRGETHKNDVLLFCQRKAKECRDNMELDDRESAELIWRFLELLIKQNGTIVGTDVADLLLEGHEPTTMDYRQTGMRIVHSLDNLDGEEDGEVDQSVVSDRSVVNKTKTVEEVTDRFRHLLLYGRKKDALEWAMKNNLWGHALFLASKMDSRAHANVMTRFANVAMRLNDPLQTLYQLMSGRQPAAVTCVAEERWGDWRPHLAMILSNNTSRPDLDRKSISQLGDTLAAKGFLHASHFCYLMSQTGFGSYTKKTSKIVLIGSSHSNLSLEMFATNEAVQCTEIYEYALALGNTAICLHNFQIFKYLYATRLSDWGFPQEALQYCEVIAKNVNMNPAFFQHTLVKLVYDLASQLKFCDPQRLEETDDTIDPEWLRGLHTTLVQFEEGAIQTMSGSATPMYFSGTRASSESGEVGMYMQGGEFGSQGSFQQENGYGGQGQMYSIQEQYSYHQGYHQGQGDFNGHVAQEQGHTQQELTADSQHQSQDLTDGSQGHQAMDNQWQQYSGVEGHHQQTGNETQAHWQQGYTGYDQHQWPSMPQQQKSDQNVATETASQSRDNTFSANQNLPFQDQFHNQITDPHTTSSNKQSGFPPNTNLSNSIGSTTSTKHESLASTSSFSRGDSQVAEDDDDDSDEEQDAMGSAHQPGIFDLVQPAGPQRIIAPRLRKRTISGDSIGSNSTTTSSKVQQSKKEEKKPVQEKSKSQSKSSEGIWGKIGGLFRGKGKNEMILPDDKEPTIVWDEDKKQWVNKDATEEDNAPTAPPPKDHELSTRAGPNAGPAEKRGSLPVAPPAAEGGGNMFQRRKGPLGARGQYVDVLNPKPASSAHVPSNLFNTLPHAQSAPAIFVPGGGAEDSLKKHSPVPEPIQEEKTTAPPSGANGLSVHQDDNLSRSSSMSSVSQEVQQILAKKEASEAAGPSSGPVLFNPAQFQGNQPAKQPSGGAGHRLSSRRVYPK